MKKLISNLKSTQSSKFLVAFFVIASAMFAVTACEKGPAEKAGESIDQGVENTKDAYQEGVEEVQDEMDDHS
ncbi:MAG: hypothetical protein P1U47_00005 [Zhongshania sp.]|uniref:hypothetical protein n=1 Tax=Zhongshania sp. TaxID=1971902 RepID=UPI002608A85E|nr:hypothetical protein [Zhongshania sp.]MDF1690723.1 hypothetical protein [Zhongshania sp.]